MGVGKECLAHQHEFSSFCGAKVCVLCDDHKGLERCYCGWSVSGEDGAKELLEMGEVIEEDGV